jgi:hypothetical protein
MNISGLKWYRHLQKLNATLAYKVVSVRGSAEHHRYFATEQNACSQQMCNYECNLRASSWSRDETLKEKHVLTKPQACSSRLKITHTN